MTKFPRMFRVRQTFDDARVESVSESTHQQLASTSLADRIQPNQSVAIAVGSRGIANLAEIVRNTVDYVRRSGGDPFIVPAMGSHGGGTAAGQTALLERYGLSEIEMDCPIRSSMDTIEVTRAKEGFPVFFDRIAASADHVIVCNRIKPHTRFIGDVESGLMKMLLIGLGNRQGATVYHQAIQNYSFGEIIESVAAEVLARCPITMGLAILENGYDQTAHIEAVEPEHFATREPQLLQVAREMMPTLPMDSADLLIIDEIGKDISGSGMDTNVVGRKYNDHVSREDEFPKIHQIYVRGLTKATAGNATGIGMAEYCHQSAIDEMDVAATRVNCIASGHVTAAMIPIHFATDREVLAAATSQAGLRPAHDLRWMWVPDTLHLQEIVCSETYLPAAQADQRLEVLHRPAPLRLDDEGQLAPAF